MLDKGLHTHSLESVLYTALSPAKLQSLVCEQMAHLTVAITWGTTEVFTAAFSNIYPGAFNNQQSTVTVPYLHQTRRLQRPGDNPDPENKLSMVYPHLVL